ncbi:MAG: hypothetical protein ACK4SY_04475 [Pyrobaculum sp.]
MRRFLIYTSIEKFREVPHIHAKILTGALLISNGVRKDVEVVFYLVDIRKAVKISGAKVRRLYPDEGSSIGFLKKAFNSPIEVRDLTRGVTMGAGGRVLCLPKPPFTYLVKLEESIHLDTECGVGVDRLPPHHQVVVVNIMADRIAAMRQ